MIGHLNDIISDIFRMVICSRLCGVCNRSVLKLERYYVIMLH